MLIYLYVVLHIFTQLIFFNIKFIIPVECNNFNGIKSNNNVNRASYLLKDPEYPYFTYLPNTHNNFDKTWYPGQLFLQKPNEEDDNENTDKDKTTDSSDLSHKNTGNTPEKSDPSPSTDESTVNSKEQPDQDNISSAHTQTINPAKGITINNNIQPKQKHEDIFADIKQAIYSLYERAKDKGIEIDKQVQLNTTQDMFNALNYLSKLIESYTYDLKSLDTGINQQFDSNSESLDNTVPDTSAQFLQLSKSAASSKESESTNQQPSQSIDELRSFLDEFMDTLNEVISKNTGVADLLGRSHPHTGNSI